MDSNSYFDMGKAGKVIDKLTLSHENQLKAKTLVNMLGDGLKINMGEAGRKLWPNATSKSQSTMLNSLVRAINSAADKEGLSFEIVPEGAIKYGNDKRWLGFIGIPDAAPIAFTREYDDAKNAADGNEIIAANYAPQTSIALLIACNEHERDAVDTVFGPYVEIIEGRTQCYVRYPKCGNYEILMRYIDKKISEKQGQVSAAVKANSALYDFENTDYSSKIRVVIGVGIAAGLDEGKQKLGDVLIATQSQDLDLGRLNPDNTKTYRGGCTDASEKFLQSYSTVADVKKYPFSTHPGLIVCASELLDNKPIKNEILTEFPEAIGYEMESYGLASAVSAHSREFFMIKGICDWGEGIVSDGDIKDKLQLTAALNAAEVLRDILNPGNVSPSNPFGPRAKTEDYELRKDNLQPLRTNTFHYEERIEQIKKLAAPSEEGSDIVSLLEEWACTTDGKDNRIKLLLGEYGMGKTITCQTLYERLLVRCKTGQSAPIPLYFDLRSVTNLKNGVPGLNDVMLECAKRGWIDTGNKETSLDDIYGWLDDGALVIFDGLDEVLQRLDAEDGKTFTRGLLSIVNIMRERRRKGGRGEQNKILISSRTQFFRTLEEERGYFTDEERGDKRYQNFDALVLLPFNTEQIRAYLTNALPDLNIASIMDILDNTHNLSDLSQRPFALRLISEQIPELEQMRIRGATIFSSTLYKGIVKRWAMRDQSKSKMRPEDKLLLVSHLAAHMLRNKLNDLSALDLEDWFHEWLDGQPRLARRFDKISVDQLEEDLRNSTFLSRRDEDDDKGYYYFSHTSFREYFTSLYMLYALRDDAMDCWRMPIPSKETLDFLHQSIAEDDHAGGLMATLNRWLHDAKGDISLMILHYALRPEPSGSTVRTTPLLDGINLDGANLNGFKLPNNNQAPKRAVTFRNASFKGTKLIGSQFEKVDFTGACFEGADLSRSCMTDCNLHNCILRNATLDGVYMRYCDMSNAVADVKSALDSWWIGCKGIGHVFADEPGAIVLPAGDQRDRRLPPANRQLWDYKSIFRVTSITFSPDGAKVVYASGGRICSMDVISGRVEFSFPSPSANSVAFSADGTRLAVGHLGGATIYDAQSGDVLTIIKDVEWVHSVVFSADGARLAVGHVGGAAIYDTQSGVVLTTIEDVRFSNSVAFSADGIRLAVGHDNGAAIYDAQSGGVLTTIIDVRRSKFVSFSADGARLAVVSYDDAAIYDAQSGDVLTTIENVRWVEFIAFSVDGARLAVGYLGGATIYDAQSGDVLVTIKDVKWTKSVAFSADGVHLAVVSYDGAAIYDASCGDVLTTIEDVRQAESIAFSADGTRLAVGYLAGATIYDAQGGDVLATIMDVRWAKSVAFSADGVRLAVGHDIGVTIYDAQSGNVLTIIKNVGWDKPIAFSADGACLAVGYDDGVAIYDTQSGDVLTTNEDVRRAKSVAFSADGARLAVGHWGGTAIYDAQSGDVLTTIENVERVNSVAFSADDACLAVGHEYGATIYDAQSGDVLTTIEDMGSVKSVAFSADDARLAVCDDFGKTTIYYPKSTLPLLTLTSDFESDCTVKYAADGSVEKLGKDAWKRFCWRIPPVNPGESPKLLPLEAFNPAENG
jgi:WD40 repeat protein/nucleoside phosphorylase